MARMGPGPPFPLPLPFPATPSRRSRAIRSQHFGEVWPSLPHSQQVGLRPLMGSAVGGAPPGRWGGGPAAAGRAGGGTAGATGWGGSPSRGADCSAPSWGRPNYSRRVAPGCRAKPPIQTNYAPLDPTTTCPTKPLPPTFGLSFGYWVVSRFVSCFSPLNFISPSPNVGYRYNSLLPLFSPILHSWVKT